MQQNNNAVRNQMYDRVVKSPDTETSEECIKLVPSTGPPSVQNSDRQGLSANQILEQQRNTNDKFHRGTSQVHFAKVNHMANTQPNGMHQQLESPPTFRQKM
jgi:hypothetical protein